MIIPSMRFSLLVAVLQASVARLEDIYELGKILVLIPEDFFDSETIDGSWGSW